MLFQKTEGLVYHCTSASYQIQGVFARCEEMYIDDCMPMSKMLVLMLALVWRVLRSGTTAEGCSL